MAEELRIGRSKFSADTLVVEGDMTLGANGVDGESLKLQKSRSRNSNYIIRLLAGSAGF